MIELNKSIYMTAGQQKQLERIQLKLSASWRTVRSSDEYVTRRNLCTERQLSFANYQFERSLPHGNRMRSYGRRTAVTLLVEWDIFQGHPKHFDFESKHRHTCVHDNLNRDFILLANLPNLQKLRRGLTNTSSNLTTDQ